MNRLETIKELAYKEKEDLFERLLILDTRKRSILEKFKGIDKTQPPLLITISGSPRTGKSTCISYLYEFFKKGGFRTITLDEPAGTLYQQFKTDDEKREAIKDHVSFNRRLREYAKQSVNKIINENNVDIILCDRGTYDTYIWEEMYYEHGLVSNEDYSNIIEEIYDQKLDANTMLFGLQCDPKTSVIRDYLNSISLEERRTTTIENTAKYNLAMNRCKTYFNQTIDKCVFIDASSIEITDLAIYMANSILDFIEKKYLIDKDNKRHIKGGVQNV